MAGILVAIISRMHLPGAGLPCFIASVINREIDPYLEQRQFCHGLVMFSIPDYGVMFRCRVEAEPIDLEYAAFFSLLKFAKTQMKIEKPARLVVHSSNPEFVFSFTPESKHLKKGTERQRMVKEYTESFELVIRFIESARNKALLSPADYPSLPVHVTPVVKAGASDLRKQSFKPFQRGVKL